MSESLEGRRVAVLGLARSGAAAAAALLERGARVTVLERSDAPEVRERAATIAGAHVVLGRTEPDDLGDAELVVASPGVPPASPWLRAASERGIPAWSEVELAYRLGVRPSIAITGTNGKTTTTEMATAALRACGVDAVAAGNVGHPLVGVLGRSDVVVELSSFQLHAIERFHAPVAVLLNLAEDHLDWHGSLDAYHADKARIFANQGAADTAIVHDDAACRRAATSGAASVVPYAESHLPHGGAGVEDGWIVVPHGRVVEVSRMRAQGRPNRADAVAAAAAVCALGHDPAAVGEALAAFEPRPHRIERLGEIDGVSYVNDSKATDPHATLAALEEMHDVVLIAGGLNKSLDLRALAAAAPKLRAVVAIGAAAAEVVAAFEPTGLAVETADDMKDAVHRARAFARPGDTVLLSPACASFDRYSGYEERGNVFKAEVAALGGQS